MAHLRQCLYRHQARRRPGHQEQPRHRAHPVLQQEPGPPHPAQRHEQRLACLRPGRHLYLDQHGQLYEDLQGRASSECPHRLRVYQVPLRRPERCQPRLRLRGRGLHADRCRRRRADRGRRQGRVGTVLALRQGGLQLRRPLPALSHPAPRPDLTPAQGQQQRRVPRLLSRLACQRGEVLPPEQGGDRPETACRMGPERQLSHQRQLRLLHPLRLQPAPRLLRPQRHQQLGRSRYRGRLVGQPRPEVGDHHADQHRSRCPALQRGAQPLVRLLLEEHQGHAHHPTDALRRG